MHPKKRTYKVSRLIIWPSSAGIFPLKLFEERFLQFTALTQINTDKQAHAVYAIF